MSTQTIPTIQPAGVFAGPKTVPLSSMRPGMHAHIFQVQTSDGNKETPQVCYLRCMGFAPGAHVELIRRVSRGALSIYRVDDADVALRQETATLISVILES
jgi:Fe2+ transport system protein FeoA